MAGAQKFLFDESFDLGPPPEVITLLRAETLQQQAYEKGLNDAKAMSHTLATAQLQLIAQKLDDIQSLEERHLSRIGEEASALAAIIVQKLFPMLAQKGALEEVKAVFQSVSSSFQDQKTISFAVNPKIADDIKNYVAAEKTSVQIQVVSDESLGISDCRLSWDQGGVERYLNWMAKEALKILASSADANLIETLNNSETAALPPENLKEE